MYALLLLTEKDKKYRLSAKFLHFNLYFFYGHLKINKNQKKNLIDYKIDVLFFKN